MATEVSNGRTYANGNGSGNGHGNGNGNGYGNGNGGSDFNVNEQIREILHVLFKRWRLAAILFLAVALPGLALTALRPRSYVASAKVLITTQRSDLSLQPTDLNHLVDTRLNESVVNSEVHIISSRELLESVAHDLLLGNQAVARVSSNASSNIGYGNTIDKSMGRKVGLKVLELGRTVSVTPIKNSNVIEVDYRSADPKRAAMVVNRVIDEYLAYHAQVHGTKGLTRFYVDQRHALEQNMRDAERALEEFASREGIADPKEEMVANVRAVADMEASLRQATAQISGTEEKMRSIEQQVAEQPTVIKRQQYIEVNPVVTALTSQLVERQIDRIGLLRKYTDEDRLVRDNAAEINVLQSRLQKEQRDHPTVNGLEVMSPNPLREERTRQMLDLESNLRELRARRAVLEENLNTANRRLVQLRTKSLEYNRLDQDVQSWRTTYELYVKREEEARVSEAMDQEKMVNVEVVQRPALPLPRSDRRQSSALLVLISGFIVSLGGAFGVEYFNRSFTSERDVERYLGLPLLGTVAETPKA